MSAPEYRVSWQRGEQRKRRALFQTLRGAEHRVALLAGTFEEAFPNRDPDGYVCCEGNPGPPTYCGCRGETEREYFDSRRRAVPALVYGPVIEVREVADWQELNPTERTER